MTLIVAWVVEAAVATTATDESESVLVAAPSLMKAVDDPGAIVVEADAAAATTMLTSTGVAVTTLPAASLYDFTRTVQVYVPAVRAEYESSWILKLAPV